MVTNEISSEELGFIDREFLVEDSTWYGLNQCCVIDVTPITLLIGGSKCGESGELKRILEILAVLRLSSEGRYFMHARSCQAKNML